MRGRKAKPTILKLVSGNPGKRAVNGQEPRPSAALPDCPAWLDKEAKAKWKALAPELARMGLLTLIDGDALAGYCQAWSEFRLATETLRKANRFVTAQSGYVSPHPAVAQQRSAWSAMRAFAALFGLDPSSRGRLKVASPAAESDESKFNDFLTHGKKEKA